MLFWIAAGGLATLVAWLIARPLLGPPAAATPAPSPDVLFYRAQLEGIGRDVERGTLPASEAERARAEVARRLLAADRDAGPPPGEGPRGAGLLAAAGGAALLVLGSLGLYGALGSPGAADAPRADRVAAAQALMDARPSQAEAEALTASLAPEPEGVPADYLASVEALRAAVPARADDPEGWRLLALHEGRLGRHAASARAQERLLALLGDAATPADRLALADRLVAAAGGVVTAAAEDALAGLERLAPRDPGLLYYRGLLQAQVGRPDLAFPLWRAAIEGGGDSLHRDLALAQMGDVAWLAGRDWAPPPDQGAAP